MRIISLQEGAARSSRSLRTLQRQIAEGKGPPVVKVTERRRGILEPEFEEGLRAHRRTVPRNRDQRPPSSEAA